MMTTLTWLHLSDWHQQGKDFNREIVRNALIRDIRERTRIDPLLKRVNLVIFSGDLSFRGKEEEYQAAREYLLDPVLEAVDLNLKPDCLFIVPGNHDLDRDLAFDKDWAPAALQNPIYSEEIVNDWLVDTRKRKRALEPFEAYHEFIDKYTTQKSPDYASTLIFTEGEKQIGLLGLNSAWLCARHKEEDKKCNDYGFAIVGEPQLREGLNQLECAHLRIAVLHHPFEWLADFDRFRVKILLRKKCHFILTGHEHCPQVEMLHGTLGECITIPAGASYDRRVADNPRYTNAYNFVYFDLETYKGVVYLRRWNDDKDEWEADQNSYTDGKYPFSLGKKLEVK